MKRAGLLMPISSLPSQYGIGDFGKEAYTFVDKIKEAKVKIWQILPLNPLGYGNSPYQPLSSQAGDEIFISLDGLKDDGLLNEDDLIEYYAKETSVHYEDVRRFKTSLYKKAYRHFVKNDEYNAFVEENQWVHDYAIFRVFKTFNDNKAWIEWEDKYKNFNNDLDLTEFKDDIDFHIFLQYYFYKQWNALKKYANDNGIIIIGDMPIYVGLDSDDVWKNQDSFLLDEEGKPTFVAGVPPDYFSKTGQRWGNPIYDWDYLKENGFKFWVERMKAAMKMYDTVRIDHFRAFDTFWKIPASQPTAVVGKWIEAPGYDLFDALYKELPNLNVLAEDLGDLRDEVYELRDHYKMKGMYVFQFHRHEEFDMDKVVVYTGTHDNDTLNGWIETLDKKDTKKLVDLLKTYKEKEVYKKIIHYCLDLKAQDVIVPVWDLVGEDASRRFNVPGQIGSPNWEYKIASFKELDESLEFFGEIIKSSKRNAK